MCELIDEVAYLIWANRNISAVLLFRSPSYPTIIQSAQRGHGFITLLSLWRLYTPSPRQGFCLPKIRIPKW